MHGEMTSSSLRDTESSSRSLLDKELNAPKNLFEYEVIQKKSANPSIVQTGFAFK